MSFFHSCKLDDVLASYATREIQHPYILPMKMVYTINLFPLWLNQIIIVIIIRMFSHYILRVENLKLNAFFNGSFHFLLEIFLSPGVYHKSFRIKLSLSRFIQIILCSTNSQFHVFALLHQRLTFTLKPIFQFNIYFLDLEVILDLLDEISEHIFS